MSSGRAIATLAAGAVLLLLPACGGSAGSLPPAASSQPPANSGSAPPRATPSSPPALDCAQHTLAGLSRPERVGQLLMLGLDAGGDPATAIRAVTEYHLGAVTLIGRSYDGADAVGRLTDEIQQAADLPVLIATDQEGGQVQVLHGPGFPEMPSALEQGQLAPSALRAAATHWGEALRTAGVNTNLAPVLDVVPAALGAANQPIGRYDRQYGSSPARVTTDGLAFADGMRAAQVTPVVKHFPGLGAVRGNTDVSSDVVDTVTSANSPSLQPFRAAVDAGVPVVMVSSAYYALIDPDRPAMFSAKVVTGLLRGDLGFRGVVLTDDIGHAAAAVAYGSLSRRAVDFVTAGGDMLLTVDVATVPALRRALLDRAEEEAGFAARIDASALRVLELKQEMGLLPCSG